MSSKVEQLRVHTPFARTAWSVAAAAVLIVSTIEINALTANDTPATSQQRSATGLVPLASDDGVPAYRTELVMGGLEPAPGAAILTPKMVPGFSAGCGAADPAPRVGKPGAPR